jgi:type I restriction enzyme, S subunit
MMEKQLIPAGYKQTEVGVIPEDWEVSLLKNLTIDMLQGVNTAIDIPEYVEGGIPMLKANNVIDQVVKFSGADSISLKTFLSYSDRYRLKKDDFLFSNIGARLGTGSLLEVDIDCSFAWNVMRIVPDQRKIKPKFLAYQINSPKNSEKIKSEQSGSGMGFIPKSTMQQVTLALPLDLEEQTAIANALSDVDALIAALEKLINKKSAIKTAAMQQLLTGKKRVPPFDQLNTGYKQTELGEIPGDWEVYALANTCSMKSGAGITSEGISDSGKYPCYGGNGLRGYTQSFTHDGEFALIGRQGALCGNIVSVKGQFFASEHAIVVTPNQKTNIDWLAYILYRMNLNQYSESSAQPGLSVSKLLVFKIICPSLKEQTAIANVLSDMDKDLEALQQRLHKTQQIKQGMMQELLTGKTRLIKPEQVSQNA